MIHQVIFFLLFGAERLHRNANRWTVQRRIKKAERRIGAPSSANTQADLDVGGKTVAVDLAQKAEAAGVELQ